MTTDLITERYYSWNADGTGLLGLEHGEQDAIRDLLLGRKVEKVADDHLRLDDGTLLRVVPNEGGCACSAGDYVLADLNGVDNIITSVEFDYAPTGDGSYDWNTDEPYDPPQGYYRIFVFADNQRVNLLSVEGDDGNGYYGTGFSILVRPASA